jgi:hypothetical protein
MKVRAAVAAMLFLVLSESEVRPTELSAEDVAAE